MLTIQAKNIVITRQSQDSFTVDFDGMDCDKKEIICYVGDTITVPIGAMLVLITKNGVQQMSRLTARE